MEQIEQSNYKEKYEQALAKARALINSRYFDDEWKNDVIDIFPELKPCNEYDRIKKNCIHFLELQKQHHASNIEIDECIKWVEKQKYIGWNDYNYEQICKIINQFEIDHLNEMNAKLSSTYLEWLQNLKSQITE